MEFGLIGEKDSAPNDEMVTCSVIAYLQTQCNQAVALVRQFYS